MSIILKGGGNNGAYKSGKAFSADFGVTLTFGGLTDMNGAITDDAQIDGSVTMSFFFAI